MNGKGFYIALAICLVAVGSAAYVAANSSIGLLNGGTTSSAASSAPGGTSAPGATQWGVPESAAQTNQVVSGITKTPSSSSSATASSSKKSSSSMTNDKGEKLVFMLPCNGEIITPFSNNDLAYNKTMDDWRVHNGIDIAAKAGTPVVADADGTVTSIKEDLLLGETVVISHGSGLTSTFANLTKQVTVKKGQKVSVGDILGCVGQTAQGESLLAPHLHYELWKNGNAINPMTYIKQS
ncbi:MAG: M23 family metallopeptidase [Clostridia bacterium]|nr:M23 family metallopeptidase [Clostridia bacterium]